MAGGVVAEFLASIGFQTDEASLNGALGKVKMFAVAVSAVAAGATAAVMSVANKYDDLGKTAERLHMPVEKLQEMQFVAEQTGASADAVAASLQGIASKNPYIKDTAAALERAGRNMRGMSDAGRKIYALNMGIDPTLIPMLTKDVSGLRAEFQDFYKTAGIDGQAAAQASREFLAELGKLKSIGALLKDAVGIAFIGKIKANVEALRRGIVENFGKIKAVLQGVINIALRITSGVAALAGRVIGWLLKIVGWFEKMDSGTRTIILSIGAMLAAWKLLNAGFLATPLGAVIAGLVAIVALVDDYLTYMEGGESFFDWGPWEGTINKVVAAITPLVILIKRLAGAFLDALGPAIDTIAIFLSGMATQIKLVADLFTALFEGDFDAAIKAGLGLIDNFIATFKAVFKGLVLTILTYFSSLFGVDLVGELVGLTNAISAWINGVKNMFSDMCAAVSQFFADLWGKITGSVPDVGGMVKKAMGAFGGALDWFKAQVAIDGPENDTPHQFAEPGNDNRPSGDSPGNIAPPPSRPVMLAGPPEASITPSPATAAALTQSARAERPSPPPVKIDQTTEIKIMGSDDPEATAQAVARQQGGVNGELVRNMKGALR